MTDYTIDDVIFLPFTTRAFATGIPTVLTGSQTVEIYEDAGTTPIVEGASKLVLTISLNSVAGFNVATVTLSAANGFEAGKHYTLIIKTGTVGGVSVVGEVVGEFTIGFGAAFARLGAPAGASVSADIADIIDSLKGVVPVKGTIGATGNDTTHLHLDGLTYGNDEIISYSILIFDNSTSEYHLANITDWVLSTELAEVPTLPFTPEASVDTYWLLSSASVGGVWDETLTGANHNIPTSSGRRLRSIQDFGIYDMASVWVDEVNGQSTGIVDGEDATVTNRADDLDNAVTVANSIFLDRMHIQSGNNIPLTAALDGFEVWGALYTLALGGNSIAGSLFRQATISGIGTGANPQFHNCVIGTSTLPPARFILCSFTTTMTIGSAGDYRLIDCNSGVAGPGGPTVDFAAIGATTFEARDWRGSLTLDNLAAGDVVTIDGILGTITLNGADATVEIRGTYKAIVNNLTGSPTVNIAGAILGASLPDAAADTAGGIPVSDAGGLDIDTSDANIASILALLDDARSEPGQGALPVNPDAMTKIDYLYKLFRNKKDNDGTTTQFYADNTTTVDHKQTTSSVAGTVTKTEIVSGP